MRTLRRSVAVAWAFRVAVLGAAIILAAGALPALAQQTVTSATLGGRVQDANGAALPGVTVTATNTETNQSKTSTTDGEGRYRFSYLPVGTYRVKAEKQGFAALTTQLTLALGQALEVPFCPTRLDADVLALDIPCLFQALAERIHEISECRK